LLKGLNAKLIITIFMAFIIVCISATVGYISVDNSIKELEKRSFDQLKSIRDIKKSQINDLFVTIKNDIEVLAKSNNVQELIRDLIYIHKILQVKAGEPYPAREQIAIDTMMTHEEFFQNYIKQYNYSDIFFVCKKHGHVMYTAKKESDLGQNLSSGELKNSVLYDAWNKAISSGKTQIVDMRPYEPNGNKPTMFVATPVVFDKKVRAALILEISEKKINDIMNLREGMGDSGDSYLVGQDKLMRSDSYVDKQNHSLHASFEKSGSGRVETYATSEALSGNSDVKIIDDFRGVRALSAYTNIDINDSLRWALITQIDESEILKSVHEYENKIAMSIMIITLISLIVGYVFIGIIIKLKVTKPIENIVDELTQSSVAISSSSTQLTGSAISLSDVSSSQASSVEQILEAIEANGSIITLNFNNTTEANDITNHMKDFSEHGTTKIKELLSSMDELDASSKKISNIVTTIDEIAFQTNLLALNAAVEAARAGEHGLGFAVVAEEVRALAGRSSEEAKAISSIIDETIKVAQNGQNIAKSTSEYFTEISDRINKVSTLMAEISHSSNEQKIGSEKMSNSITTVDNMTQNIASSAEEIAASSEELNSQAINSERVVEKLASMVGLKQ
jgi:methyl-accepting chemotaxis protein